MAANPARRRNWVELAVDPTPQVVAVEPGGASADQKEKKEDEATKAAHREKLYWSSGMPEVNRRCEERPV